MTTPSYDTALQLIDAIEISYQANFNPRSKKAWASELSEYSVKELEKAFKRFQDEYESLPYQFSVARGLIKQLKPTLTAATVEERLYSSLQDKNPYEFLKKISPKLMQLADAGGLFDKQITIADQGFRVRDIAKRFLEWQQNERKGFIQAEPESDLKRLEFTPQQFQRVQNPLKGLPISEAAKLAAEKLKNANS